MGKNLLDSLVTDSQSSYEETYESIKSNVINIINDDHPIVDRLISNLINKNKEQNNLITVIGYKIARYERRLIDMKVIQVQNYYDNVIVKITGTFDYDGAYYSFETFATVIL